MGNENQNDTGSNPHLNDDELRAAAERVIGIDPAQISDEERLAAQSLEVPEEKPNPFDDPHLRREAGEGWHPNGLNRVVLGAIVAREAIAGAVGDTRDEVDRKIMQDEFKSQQKHVAELKMKFGVWDAPRIDQNDTGEPKN